MEIHFKRNSILFNKLRLNEDNLRRHLIQQLLYIEIIAKINDKP
jgi:hypothetical protein